MNNYEVEVTTPTPNPNPNYKPPMRINQMKQVKFLDTDNNVIHGGLLTDNGDIICGCCGGLIPADEIGEGEKCQARIIKIYNDWMDLDFAILD